MKEKRKWLKTLTSASSWSPTDVWASGLLLTKQMCLLHWLLMSQSDSTSHLTPDVRVIHTRLVIGQSDEWRVWGSPVNQVKQDLLVVDRQVVHILWVPSLVSVSERIHSGSMLLNKCVFQLTGPEVGIWAHHAHHQWAGDPPRQRRAHWERPFDLQRHRTAPHALHPHTP